MNFCSYCGDVADTVDHVIPLSWNRVGARTNSGANGSTSVTPACRDCNINLSNVPIHSISGRRAYLAKKLAAKLKRIRKVMWTADELDELGTGELRQRVEGGLHARAHLEQRVEALCA